MYARLRIILSLLPVFASTVSAHADWLSETQSCILNLTQNQYKFSENELDCKSRVASLDCSGFVGEVASRYFPKFYADVLKEPHLTRPSVRTYASLFLDHPNGSNYLRLRVLSDLRAGDLLLWVYSPEYRKRERTESTGHIMLVVGPATPTPDPRIFLVKVADSARSPHANDTRKTGQTGLGVGTLSIRLDSQGVPADYSWSDAGIWQSGDKILMARMLK